MRQAFIQALCALAERHPELMLLSGDLGFSVLEEFSGRFPQRYVNVGVAEQNMMGLAAGLASSGKIVFTYSIANFALLRCLEQFRNDICYHSLPVIAVSVGAGMSYGAQGYTHHGIEDVGLSRLLPHLAVVSPGDPAEVRWALPHLAARRAPASLRLGRGGEPVVHQADLTGKSLDKAFVLRPCGRDVTLAVNGALLQESEAAATQLAANGLDVGLISMPVIKPFDASIIEQAARTSRLILTVEEHLCQGGLGSAVAEVVANLSGARARVLRAGLGDCPVVTAVSQAEARRRNGIDAAGLMARAFTALE